MKTFAIIAAGGKGTRSGFFTPKQYLKFNKKELIAYTLQIFQKNVLVDEIIITADPSCFSLLEKIKKKYRLTKITNIIEGGKTRQDSVYNALISLKAQKKDLVIVHDAVRPFLPQDVLTKSINLAKEKGNAVVCIKAKDTLIKGKSFIESYLIRDEIYYVQTPQIFKHEDLLRAMNFAYDKKFYGTDESMLLMKINKKINIVEGAFINFKVTTKSDIELVKKLVKK